MVSIELFRGGAGSPGNEWHLSSSLGRRFGELQVENRPLLPKMPVRLPACLPACQSTLIPGDPLPPAASELVTQPQPQDIASRLKCHLVIVEMSVSAQSPWHRHVAFWGVLSSSGLQLDVLGAT